MSSRREFLIGGTSLVALLTTPARAQSIPLSPNWARAIPAGPDVRVKITEEYAKSVGRDAYFWAWPMVNIYNRRIAFPHVKEAVKSGPLLQAPLNQIAMPTDYVDPEERAVACPNQDVVYGIGTLSISRRPWYKCLTSVIVSGCIKSSICGPTALFNSAKCTARHQASICWSAQAGKVTCRRESRRFFVRLPTPA